MRAMEAELGMYKQQVDLFKSDIEAANEAMRELRNRWIAKQMRSKSNQRLHGGSHVGADETINLLSAGSEWDASPSHTAAPASANNSNTDGGIPLLLQDVRGGSGGGGVSPEKSKLVEEGKTIRSSSSSRPEGSVATSSPAVAAG